MHSHGGPWERVIFVQEFCVRTFKEIAALPPATRKDGCGGEALWVWDMEKRVNTLS